MQVKALEDYLQIRLLRRSSHRVELTAEGERLVPSVQRGLDELEQGFRLVRAELSGGVLVASLPSSFLNSWLVSRLPDFFAAHPDIDLRMQCTKQLTDFARFDVHVAIRMGRGDWPGLHAEKLFSEYLVPLCSPELLARYGAARGTWLHRRLLIVALKQRALGYVDRGMRIFGTVARSRGCLR